MSTQIIQRLPETKSSYMIPAGEGDRYVFGTQVASIIANARSIGDSLEVVQLSGGRGDRFPLHTHERASEAIYVLDGKLEVQIGTQKRLLTTGDYAHIPAGIPHACKMLAHRTRFYSVTIGGEVSDFYRRIGAPYERHERPHLPQEALPPEQWAKAAEGLDIRFVDVSSVAVEIPIIDNGTVPDRVVPYVLENGDGDHTLSGDAVHSFLTTQAAAGGGYIIVMSTGPKGNPIGEHYHDVTNEIFIGVQGSFTLWVDGEEMTVQPGDFVYVPAGVKHKFRMDSHYTKFMGILTPGSFEDFFRTLGDPYDYPIFPLEPAPYRFDRVIRRITELDVKVTGRPPGVPGPAEGQP